MKQNIIIDGSFLLHQTYHVTNLIFDTKKKVPTTEEFFDLFFDKFIKDLNRIILLFDDVDRIILCLDDRSWRKNISTSYKGNRIKKPEDKEKWEAIYKTWDETVRRISEVSTSNGILVSRCESMEADDLIYFWSDYFFRNGDNTLIIGNDNDLIQLIKFYNEKLNFVIYLQFIFNNKRLCVVPGTLSALEKHETSQKENKCFDIFSEDFFKHQVEDNSNLIKKILNKTITLYEIYPETIVTEKIFLGDSSDNIFSCYVWKGKNGSRDKRVTKKFHEDVIEQPNFSLSRLVSQDAQLLETIKILFESRSKSNIDMNLLKENLAMNTRLIYLSRDSYPKDLLPKVLEHIKNQLCSEQYLKLGRYKKEQFYKDLGLDVQEKSITIYA